MFKALKLGGYKSVIDTLDILGSSRKFIQMLNATVQAYEKSLYVHLSSPAYRNFCLWGISKENPSREVFLQIVGITQLAKLTTLLLGDLAQNEQEWQRFIESSQIMNAWQIHEIVSDNLAIGLAYDYSPPNQVSLSKYQLIYDFNETIISYLNGLEKSPLELEKLFKKKSENISLFQQSLIPNEYRRLGEEYVEIQNIVKLNDLECMVWAPLTANIISCFDLVQTIDLPELNTIILNSLILRYQSVNELLEFKAISFERFLELSSYTILVIPTLAYYIAVLAKNPSVKFFILKLISNGILTDILHNAALIVRLLNDLGTPLLTLAPDRQKIFIDRLKFMSRQSRNLDKNFFEFIIEVDDQFLWLNRIQKDVIFGEVNIGLYKINREHSLPEAILQFEKNLNLLSLLYLKKRSILMKFLAKTSQSFYGLQISKLIKSFVLFHEKLYSKSYTTCEGEYAIYNRNNSS